MENSIITFKPSDCLHVPARKSTSLTTSASWDKALQHLTLLGPGLWHEGEGPHLRPEGEDRAPEP